MNFLLKVSCSCSPQKRSTNFRIFSFSFLFLLLLWCISVWFSFGMLGIRFAIECVVGIVVFRRLCMCKLLGYGSVCSSFDFVSPCTGLLFG